MYEVYQNDIIEPYEDAGGVTNTARAGQRRVGNSFFTGEPLAAPDQVISRRLVCDRCGCPPKSKAELVKQGGFMVCRGCVDG